MEQTRPAVQASEWRITEHDLQRCGAHPIHLIGSIQSYGSLVAVSLRTGRIVHAAANLQQHAAVPASQALGMPVQEVLDCSAAPRDWLQRIPRGGRWVSPEGVALRAGCPAAELVAHRAPGPEPDDERLVIEIIPGAPAAQTDHELSLFVRLAEAMGDLRSSVAVQRFLQHSAELVQSFTGYDRVMIYRFAPDWSGEVVAESTAPGTTMRFLGLNFPASDIPPQARRLYETCLLRVVADIEAEPVDLLAAETGDRLDQGQALLRQMAPTHVQYLRNMGVRATLTLSLLKEGKLWGMVACHHHSPKMPPDHIRRAVRSACELIASTVTLRLDSLLEVETAQRRAALSDAISGLGTEMVESSDVSGPLRQWQPRLLALLASQDMGIWVEDAWLVKPSFKPAALEAVANHLAGLNTSTFAITNLAAVVDPHLLLGDTLVGLLAHRLPHGDGWVMVFREERIRSLRWAGRPDTGSPMQIDGSVVLGPRRSFEVWTETVRGHCHGWSEFESDALGNLARVVYNGVQQVNLRKAQDHIELLSRSLDQLNDMVMITESDPVDFPGPAIQYVNQALTQRTGYRAADLIGQQPRRFLGPATDRTEVDRITTELAQRRPVRGTLLQYTACGETYWADTQITPMFDAQGRHTHWVAVMRDVSEQRQTLERLRDSEERIRQQFDLLEQTTARVPGMVYQFMMSAAGHYSFPFASAGIRELYGLDPEQVRLDAAPLLARLHPDDLPAVLASIQQSLKELSAWQGHYRVQVGSGGWRWHEASSAPQRLADGGTVWHGVVFDITDRMQLEQTLRAAQQAQRDTLEAIPDVLFEVDETMQVLSVRAPSEALLVAPAEDQIGHRIDELLDATTSQIWAEAIAEALVAGNSIGREYQLIINGRPLWFSLSIARKSQEVQGPRQFVAVSRDITARKQAEAQINQLAFYDPLTGLCNRRLLLERLQRAQLSSARSLQYAALVFMDLDNFKDLNDTQGHGVGDELLRQVAERLQQGVREGDTVARMGGDEFVVLLENLGTAEAEAAVVADQIGRKLLQALNVPYPLGAVMHHCTASLGITLFRNHDDLAEDVLRRADVAMYEAKAGGRNAVRFYDPDMQAAVQLRTTLDRDLRLAIERQEFELFYQPIVDAAAVVTGYEALLRWNHSSRGLVSPADFIPVAEQSGMILPIGAWVLDQACITLVGWANDPARQHLTLAVNLSARQLQQTDFVQQVRDTLVRHGLKGSHLKLELTESLLQQDVEQTIVKMRELAGDGIRFALDDFGTGYSSLIYLKQLPLSQLKIDRSFVRDVLTDPNDAAIARTILQLALTLDMSVVAEGIETEGQLAALRAMGCQAFQGYLFGKPQPLAALG